MRFAVDLRMRRVVQIHPSVGHEAGVQLDTEQPLLYLDQFIAAALVAEDGERPGEGDLPGLRVVDMDLAPALADVGVVPVGDDGRAGVGPAAADVEHPPVGCRHQAVRLADLVVLPGLVGPGHALGGVVGVDGGLAVCAREARGPGEGAAKMVAEVGPGEAVDRTAHAGVEGAAAVVVTAPGDWVVPAVGAGGGLVRTLLDAGHGVHAAGRVRRPVEPGVRPLPLQRKRRGGRMPAVADLDDRALHRARCAGRPGADQPGEPVGVRLGARRVMNADEASAGLQIRLQPGLLLRVEHIAAAGQKDDRVVRAEPGGFGEDGGVVRGLGREPAGGGPGPADGLDRRDTRVDGRRLGGGRGVEDEDFHILAARGRR